MTVLVVEDDAVAREGLKAILSREGYAVGLAGNGREALDYLATQARPDVILLDMLMPVVDGWEFLERLREQTGSQPVPVVVTTATVLSREWANAHGCAGFVKKPIDVGELLAELRRCAAQQFA